MHKLKILNLSENVTASFARVDEHSKIGIPIFSNFENIYKKKKKRNGSINCENVTASFARVDEHSKIEIPIFSNFQTIYKKKKEKKRNGSINFPGGKLNLIIDKNERIGRREEAEGAAAKPKRGTSASTLRIVSVWTPITRFTPSPASSSSRSPRARLFLPFKKKLAEPASRSQLARCLYRYYRLAWNGMSRKGGKKRAIPGWGQTGRLIIINGDDRQFPRYFLRFLIFRPNREGFI